MTKPKGGVKVFDFDDVAKDIVGVPGADERFSRCDFDDEEEEEAEAWTRYMRAVLTVAEKLLEEHDLELVVSRKGGSEFGPFKVVPKTSWRKSLDHVRQTINGVGMFYYGSVSTMVLESSCDTYRSCTMAHLHWVKDWARVYEGTTSKAMVDKEERRR